MELLRRLVERLKDVHDQRLRIAVEETPGQRGVYLFTPEA
jgi:hypothetical protein